MLTSHEHVFTFVEWLSVIEPHKINPLDARDLIFSVIVLASHFLAILTSGMACIIYGIDYLIITIRKVLISL